MLSPALFRYVPELATTTPWTPLCRPKTSVAPLLAPEHAGLHAGLYVKREDETDDLYGGNKVRNLEFILGEAMALKARRILTIAPYGSNFVAALAAQASKKKIPVEVRHFRMARSPQIEAHGEFTRSLGAELHVSDGLSGLTAAGAMALLRRSASDSYWCAPGGSSVTGALGHVNAALELAEQIRHGEVPRPDTIVVGVGTCGTIAGLTAGFRLAGLDIRIVGVRCVDAIVCHRFKIARLATALLARLGSPLRIRPKEITLTNAVGHGGYGIPLARSREVAARFREVEGITLDTTYTSKVVATLGELLQAGAFRGQRVLYWHTFSAAAMTQHYAVRLAPAPMPVPYPTLAAALQPGGV